MNLTAIKATDVTPPVEGTIRVVSVSSTSQAIDISSLKGDFMTMQAELKDIYIVFGTSASVVASATATSGNTRAARIPVDQDRDYSLERNATYTHMAVVTKTGETATLRYWPS